MGVRVRWVDPAGPSQVAGIAGGDWLESIDGVRTRSRQDVRALWGSPLLPGSCRNLGIRRGTVRKVVCVRPDARYRIAKHADRDVPNAISLLHVFGADDFVRAKGSWFVSDGDLNVFMDKVVRQKKLVRICVTQQSQENTGKSCFDGEDKAPEIVPNVSYFVSVQPKDATLPVCVFRSSPLSSLQPRGPDSEGRISVVASNGQTELISTRSGVGPNCAPVVRVEKGCFWVRDDRITRALCTAP